MSAIEVDKGGPLEASKRPGPLGRRFQVTIPLPTYNNVWVHLDPYLSFSLLISLLVIILHAPRRPFDVFRNRRVTTPGSCFGIASSDVGMLALPRGGSPAKNKKKEEEKYKAFSNLPSICPEIQQDPSHQSVRITRCKVRESPTSCTREDHPSCMNRISIPPKSQDSGSLRNHPRTITSVRQAFQRTYVPCWTCHYYYFFVQSPQ